MRLTPFHQRDFFIGEALERVHQTVNLGVGVLDILRQRQTLVAHGGLGGGNLALEPQHALDQRHHCVMLRFFGGVGQVEGTDGEILKVLKTWFEEPTS